MGGLQEESLASRSAALKISILKVLSIVQDSNHPHAPHCAAILDILDRFNLWAGSLGALLPSESKLSLDSRLKDVPEVWNRIGELLEDLQEAVQDCKTAVMERYTC